MFNPFAAVMSMIDYEEQIGPFISEKELERFDEHIRRKYRISKVRDRYRYIETEQAMLEFMDSDRGAAVEAILHAIDDRLAHTSEKYAERRTTGNEQVIHSNRDDLDRFRPLVSRGLYTEFKQFVDSLDADITYSHAIEIAMRERREGGRKQRSAERSAAMLNALDPDGEGDRDLNLGTDRRDRLLEWITEDANADADDEDDFEHPPHTEAGKVERIRAYLADRSTYTVDELYQDDGELPKQYLIDAIDEYCTRGGRDTATDRTREKYLDLIESEVGLVEKPNGVIYEVVDPSVLDQPAFEYKDDEQLDRSERAERVAVKALKRLRRRDGCSVGTDEIARLFADGREIKSAELGKIRDRAGEIDGMTVIDSHGELRVVVDDIDAVDDALLISAGLADAPATEPDPEEAKPIRADGGREVGVTLLPI